MWHYQNQACVSAKKGRGTESLTMTMTMTPMMTLTGLWPMAHTVPLPLTYTVVVYGIWCGCGVECGV